jgi:hypothetical protein
VALDVIGTLSGTLRSSTGGTSGSPIAADAVPPFVGAGLAEELWPVVLLFSETKDGFVRIGTTDADQLKSLVVASWREPELSSRTDESGE